MRAPRLPTHHARRRGTGDDGQSREARAGRRRPRPSCRRAAACRRGSSVAIRLRLLAPQVVQHRGHVRDRPARSAATCRASHARRWPAVAVALETKRFSGPVVAISSSATRPVATCTASSPSSAHTDSAPTGLWPIVVAPARAAVAAQIGHHAARAVQERAQSATSSRRQNPRPGETPAAPAPPGPAACARPSHCRRSGRWPPSRSRSAPAASETGASAGPRRGRRAMAGAEGTGLMRWQTAVQRGGPQR